MGPDGKPVAVVWPLNFKILNGFRRCWEQGYEQAYACPNPAFKAETPIAKPSQP